MNEASLVLRKDFFGKNDAAVIFAIQREELTVASPSERRSIRRNVFRPHSIYLLAAAGLFNQMSERKRVLSPCSLARGDSAINSIHFSSSLGFTSKAISLPKALIGRD